MAGIQVPTINRFEPQQSQSVGRSNLDVPNLASAGQSTMNAVVDIAEQQTNYYQKQHDAALDTAAKNAANQYHIYLNQELNLAAQNKGDPTKAYADYDEKAQKRFDEILNSNPDISERGKALMFQEMSQVATNYKLKRDSAYTKQYYDYDLNVTEDSAKLTVRDMVEASGYIDPNNEASFKPIDALIGRINNLYNQHGEKFGQVIRDENGQWVSDPSIKLEVGKKVSEGLVSSINNLNNSGHPELAEALYAKYYKYIDASKQDDIKKKISDESRNVKALNTVPKLIGKSPEQIEAILSKEFKNDPMGKDKAYEYLDSRTRRIDNISDRVSDTAYMTVYQQVAAKMNGPNPYVNINDMENDPAIRPDLDKLKKPGQLKALRQLISQPKDSNPAARDKAFKSFYNGDFKGMSPDKLNEMLVGLNKSDRTRVEKLYQKYNSPLTTAEEIRQMNDLGSKLSLQLQAVGYVSKKSNFNAYSNEEQVKITNAQNELMDELHNLPSNMSITDRNNYIRNFAARKKLQQDKQEANSGWFGSGEKVPLDAPPFANIKTKDQTSNTTASPFARTNFSSDADKRQKAINKWFDDHPGSTKDPSAEEIKSYMDRL